MALEQQWTLPYMKLISIRLSAMYSYIAYKAYNDYDSKWQRENVIT